MSFRPEKGTSVIGGIGIVATSSRSSGSTMRHAAPPKHSPRPRKNGFPKAAAFASVGLLAVCAVILFVLLIRFNVIPATWLIVAGCVVALLDRKSVV